MNKNLKKKLRKATRQRRKLRKLGKGVPIPFTGEFKPGFQVRKLGTGEYLVRGDMSEGVFVSFAG